MRKSLLTLTTLLLAATPAWAQSPPQHRPTTQPAQYTWDLMCLAADNHWKINGGEEITSADDEISSQLINAAKKSGAANGKDFQAVSDDMMPYFAGYLNDPHAYYELTSGEMRQVCIRLVKE